MTNFEMIQENVNLVLMIMCEALIERWLKEDCES